jgi:hypothetical protein
VAPVSSTVALGALVYLAFRNLSALLGLAPESRSYWLVPAGLVGVVVLGLLHALLLRVFRPVSYASVGQNGVPVVVTPAPIRPRDPGRHRPERVER